MTATDVLAELKQLGTAQTRKTWLNHGAPDTCLGVLIGDLKKIQKRVKKDHDLALALYDTGISEAMYLAGLIADDARMTKAELKRWVKQANWSMISDFTVPWVAAGSPHGRELAMEWIDAKSESVAAAGWATYSSLVSISDDADLDLEELKTLLARVQKTIHGAPNRVRYQMNNFVICVGSYVKPLTELAIKTAEKIGVVHVDMGNTACKVPEAVAYIQKVKERGSLGKKRKTAKC